MAGGAAEWYFLDIYMPLSGRWIRADRLNFSRVYRKAFFVFSPKSVKSKIYFVLCYSKNILNTCIFARVSKMGMYFCFMATIGDNIRRLRKSKGLTQVQLAEKLGTIQKVITDYETGKTKPPSERLPVLAKFFGVTIDELIGTEDIKPVSGNDNGNSHRHGNSRFAKLEDLFEKLSPEEQRMTLKQIKALVESREP